MPGVQRSIGLQQSGQVAALDVAHRNIQKAIALTGLVDRNDVGVIKGGGKPGLAHEALAKICAVRDLVAQHLQGNLAVQAKVGGLIDRCHTATVHEGLDAVSSDLSADGNVGRQTPTGLGRRGFVRHSSPHRAK